MRWSFKWNSISAASFEVFVEKIKAFLSRFSIRKLKMGAIIQFLDELNLQDTKVKMANLMKTIKVTVCINVDGPYCRLKVLFYHLKSHPVHILKSSKVRPVTIIPQIGRKNLFWYFYLDEKLSSWCMISASQCIHL